MIPALGAAEPWSARVGEESVAQAVQEHKLGLPSPLTKLTPLTREETTARQLVFIDGWVRPLYNAAAILFPGARDRLAVVVQNRQMCKDVLSTGQSAGGSRWSENPSPESAPKAEEE